MTERIPRERDPFRIAHMMDTSACRLDSLDDVWHCMATSLGVPTYWRGVPVWKNQFDLRRYFDLIARERFGAIIETGCQGGGSGIFFMDCLKALRIDSVYIGIDIGGGWCKEAMEYEYPHVYIRGDCLSNRVAETVERTVTRTRLDSDSWKHAGYCLPTLVVLDSVHSEEHVTEELRIYSPLADYLVVEDTDHSGHPVLGNYGPSAHEAVEKFLASDPEAQPGRDCPTLSGFLRDHEIESRYGPFTNSPGGWLRRR